MTDESVDPALALGSLGELPAPDREVDARDVFGLPLDLRLPAFSNAGPLTPAVDPSYVFQEEVLTAVLLGFARGRRVLLTGMHGAGKSTHLEQAAARLNWPCVRVNLDGHVGRVDLLGRDVVRLDEGRPITQFQEGVLPWAVQRPVALVLDEYDAGRPDVMFVLQRLLEQHGRLTMLEQGRVVSPHPAFRLFGTANTAGLGDTSGLYAGTQLLNQAQLDRWNMVVEVPYMSPEQEKRMVLATLPGLSSVDDAERLIDQMVALAGWTRSAHRQGELSVVMSPRTVLHWAESYLDVADAASALRLSFLYRCDPLERPAVAECFQRLFDRELVSADAG
ncbi:MAG: AAA family ATPase [Myxococcota bacterium]